MPERNRRAALRAVQAAADDADGKLGVPELPAAQREPEPEPVPRPEPDEGPEPVAVTPAPRRGKPARSAEALLPESWREKIEQVGQADAVEVGGERVRRRMDEETVYLAVRVPRSLRDAVRKRSERLDVSIQEFTVNAVTLLLEATARAAELD